MTKYFFKDRLFVYFWIVWKIEEKEWYSPWQDNWLDGKVWKIIWYNYCRLMPKINYYKLSLSIWWLIFNFEITYYIKS